MGFGEVIQLQTILDQFGILGQHFGVRNVRIFERPDVLAAWRRFFLSSSTLILLFQSKRLALHFWRHYFVHIYPT